MELDLFISKFLFTEEICPNQSETHMDQTNAKGSQIGQRSTDYSNKREEGEYGFI
jgi:hypothetical protein